MMKFSDNKIPLYIVLVKQFKNALLEVAKRSEVGHKKYIENDADYMNFKTVSINEYDNALMRHLFEDGEDTQLEHYTAVAWNSLARLELYLEQRNNVTRTDLLEVLTQPKFDPEVGECVTIKEYGGNLFEIVTCNDGIYNLYNYHYNISISKSYSNLIPGSNWEYKNGYKSN